MDLTVLLYTFAFIHRQNAPCLPWPSQQKLVLIYQPRRDGRLCVTKPSLMVLWICNVPYAGVAAVALFSVIYNIPRWMESTLIRETLTGNSTQTINTLRRTDLGSSFLYQLVYFDTLYYIFMFVLPLVLLTIFNSRLILVYRRFRRKRVALRGVTGSSTG